LYYEPRAVSAAELAIMQQIDELHLNYPFAGSRMLRDMLRAECFAIGWEKVAALMRRMGIKALYRRLNTSKTASGHQVSVSSPRPEGRPAEPGLGDRYYVHPYGPRLCLFGGCGRLVHPARAVLAFVDYDGVSVLSRCGGRGVGEIPKPDIFDSDQGSQFTSAAFTGCFWKTKC
jgi:putative transposase